MSVDMIACEGCEAQVPEVETSSTLDGVDLCKSCWGEIIACRDRCDHQWRRSTDHYEFSRICDECGWVEKLTAEAFEAMPEKAA